MVATEQQATVLWFTAKSFSSNIKSSEWLYKAAESSNKFAKVASCTSFLYEVQDDCSDNSEEDKLKTNIRIYKLKLKYNTRISKQLTFGYSQHSIVTKTSSL